MSKSNSNVMNQRTALVYTGAALLIGIVGIRTLLSVADEWGTIEYVTLGAIGIEFAVLLLYAFTIYSDESDDKNMNHASNENVNSDLLNSLNKNQHSLEKAFRQLNELTKAVKSITRDNARLHAQNQLEKKKANILRRYVGKNRPKGNKLIDEIDQKIAKL